MARPLGANARLSLADDSWRNLQRRVEQFFPDCEVTASPPVASISEDTLVAPGRVTATKSQIAVHWLGRKRFFVHTEGTPVLPSERRVVAAAVRLLGQQLKERLRPSGEAAGDTDLPDDAIVARYLGVRDPGPILAAIATLRAAALSTYENRQLSTGVLLLGSARDPIPRAIRAKNLPPYDLRLSTVKGIHRLCDGMHSLFLLDKHGSLLRTIDVDDWGKRVQGSSRLETPCPRHYQAHANATRDGGHICLVLMPSHEIKIFAKGEFACAYSVAHWRVLDIATKARMWAEAVGNDKVATRLFTAALNMAEDRHGALFVVLRKPSDSLESMVAPHDRITMAERSASRKAEKVPLMNQTRSIFHGLVAGHDLLDIESSVLESIAGIDGAVVTNRSGKLLSFGAILRVPPGTPAVGARAQGARTSIAYASSHAGPVLKVSEDGVISMFDMGRKVWDL